MLSASNQSTELINSPWFIISVAAYRINSQQSIEKRCNTIVEVRHLQINVIDRLKESPVEVEKGVGQ
jgi:hypothetical protein